MWWKALLGAVAVASVPLLYWACCLLVVTLGVGNEGRFASAAFRLSRANKLLELTGRPAVSSLPAATALLLPEGAHEASWTYDTGDDSWLCAIATLKWRQAAEVHQARWVLRYCAGPLWREHYIEAAALNAEASILTPALAKRDSIYGSGAVPSLPADGARCWVQ